MGADFVRKCAKAFEKSWDRGKSELGAPDLFKRDPIFAARIYCANLAPGTDAVPGREFLLRVVDSGLQLYDGCAPVGSIKDSPPSLVAALTTAGCGAAVAKVVRVHELSGVVDVSVA